MTLCGGWSRGWRLRSLSPPEGSAGASSAASFLPFFFFFFPFPDLPPFPSAALPGMVRVNSDTGELRTAMSVEHAQGVQNQILEFLQIDVC